MSRTTNKELDPGKLDLSMGTDEFVIYYENNPLLTPGGNQVAHQDSRLIKHLLLKLTLNGNFEDGTVSSYNLFSFLKDYIESGIDPVGRELNSLIEYDDLLGNGSAAKTQSAVSAEQAITYLEKNQNVLNLIYWGASVINESLKDLLSELDVNSNLVSLPSKLHEYYVGLSAEEKSVVNLLTMVHNCGIILPILLVASKVSPSEYANAAVAVHAKNPQRKQFDFGEEFKRCSFELDFDDPEACIKIIHTQALRAVEFLGFFEKTRKKITVIREMISQGESDQVEFKSTFRWDLRQNKKNPAIEHAALKTMAAFLNSGGGDLLIGVEDDGNILGIEADGLANDDKFLLHVWALIKSSMGQDISPYIKTTLEKFNGKTVCRANMLKSPKPVFLRQKGFDEAFYIRSGPGTVSLEISEALVFIQENF